MRVRAIDVDGDWTFGKGQNDYKRDLSALSQNLKTRLLSFVGDCFFEATAGVDWFNLLGSKNQLALNLAISAQILNTEGVTGVHQVSINLDIERRLVISYKIQTVFSPIADIFQFDLTGLV